MRLDWLQSLATRGPYRNVYSFHTDSLPWVAYLRAICLQIACGFFPVLCCVLLSSLVGSLPIFVIIVTFH